jgi:ATP-dependent RNA helicase RhlE
MHSSQEVGATSDFRGLGIAPALLTILENLRFKNPTPIQARAIPRGIEGEDIIGIAQTGTGKTLAFGVPLIQRLAEGKGLGLILVPTRELASQVEEELARLTRPLSMRTCLLIGGASMNRQIESIRRNPDIVIATPGRLNDHLAQGTIRLSGVEAVVFDEADRMLDMGFWPQIKIILTALPEKKQTMLFSATLPSQILTMARTHMRSPVHIEVAPPGTTADKARQSSLLAPNMVPKDCVARLRHSPSE